MIIPIDDLTSEPLRVRKAIPPEVYGGEVVLLESAEIDIEFIKSGRKIEASGSIRAVLELVCSRCLENFPFNIDSNHRLRYLPEEDYCTEMNVRLKKDELSVIYYAEPFINLYEDIRQTIHLKIPIKPVCAEDCRGLCPSCGADLNMECCDCGGCAANLQFAKLEQLRKEL